jgi:hypothetical protein
MTQVLVDDNVLKEARNLTSLTSDADIVAKALSGFVARKRIVKQADTYFSRDNGGKPRWDPEFAGLNPDEWNSRNGR